MATFDESKVINGLHTDKAEFGKKYYKANSLARLKVIVENQQTDFIFEISKIDVKAEYPFVSENGNSYQFLYPYEEPSEVWYVYKALGAENKYTMNTIVYRIPREFEGTKEECKQWIKDHEVTSEESVQYVPFETVEELIEYWNHKRFNGKPPYNTKLEKPLIWIKHNKDMFLITKFKDNTVSFCNVFWDMEDLFEQCTFLDGSLIGKLKD